MVKTTDFKDCGVQIYAYNYYKHDCYEFIFGLAVAIFHDFRFGTAFSCFFPVGTKKFIERIVRWPVVRSKHADDKDEIFINRIWNKNMLPKMQFANFPMS